MKRTAVILLLALGLLFYRHRLNRKKRELAERKVKQPVLSHKSV